MVLGCFTSGGSLPPHCTLKLFNAHLLIYYPLLMLACPVTFEHVGTMCNNGRNS